VGGEGLFKNAYKIKFVKKLNIKDLAGKQGI
jgi:hypothetical protein